MLSARKWFKGPVVQGTEEELAEIEREYESQVGPPPTASAGELAGVLTDWRAGLTAPLFVYPKPRMNLASSDILSGDQGGLQVSSASTSSTPGT